jgi:hypothetical protein
MRPTPKEIAKSPDQDLIKNWIREASIEELREFLKQDISDYLKQLAVTALSAQIIRQAMKSQGLKWWIFRAIIVCAILAIIAIILRRFPMH